MKNWELQEKLNNAGLPNEEKQGTIPSEAANSLKRVYTPKEIREQLSIGKTATYDLLNRARKKGTMFRVIKVGDSIRVPIKEFEAWLEGGAENG